MVEIDLCTHPECEKLWEYWRGYLADQRESAYVVPRSFPAEACFNATARNRYRYAEKLGYTCMILDWEQRNFFLDEIHEINNSLPERQGRKMTESYVAYPSRSSEKENECLQHRSILYTVFSVEKKLVGYINGCYCGEMAAASQIIGHADHLKNGIMLLLWDYFVAWSFEFGAKHIIYSRWGDGTKGLQYWKHSVGMRAEVLKEKI